MKETIVFQTQNLHLDEGELVPAQVRCAPGKPLEIRMGNHPGADIELPGDVHIALGRADPHVHFRESVLPSREEFEADPYRPQDLTYEQLVEKVKTANDAYDARRGSLAALKGGVWLAGAMGNTPWAPVGEERWKKNGELYRERSLIYTHVWPRMEPGVPPIPGQEEKDFGSTFGGAALREEERRRMYRERAGGMVSYHNDRERPDETLEEFKNRIQPPDFMLQPLYYDGSTVYDMQRETLLLALSVGLKRLLTRHIPTGLGLDMILSSRSGTGMELPAEVGLDYLYFNRDMLATRPTRAINYRRPAFPSREDQAALIELLRDCARLRDPLTFLGSDHAPHPPDAKAFRKNGLPGSPGTRVLEHTHQIHMNLIHKMGYTHADIDWLAAIVPAKYIAQYRSFPYPVGTLREGAMANLVVFHPSESYKIVESSLKSQLQDSNYHTAYRDEALAGKVWFTVVDGVVYDVRGEIMAMNATAKRQSVGEG